MGFYLTISVTLTKTNMQNNLNRGIIKVHTFCIMFVHCFHINFQSTYT
jgi:hypothetical protein